MAYWSPHIIRAWLANSKQSAQTLDLSAYPNSFNNNWRPFVFIRYDINYNKLLWVFLISRIALFKRKKRANVSPPEAFLKVSESKLICNKHHGLNETVQMHGFESGVFFFPLFYGIWTHAFVRCFIQTMLSCFWNVKEKIPHCLKK